MRQATPTRQQDLRSGGRVSWWGVLVALGLLAYLCWICLRYAAPQPMWLDEFFAWNLLADPSLGHALQAWQAGADSGGPLFYVLGHVLLVAFRPSPTVIRLFQVVCVWGAGVVWFAVVRRYAGNVAALVSIVVVWSADPQLLWLATNVRFYGLFLFTASCVVWCGLRVVRRPGYWSLGLYFVANIALVLSHALGAVYSALALLALVLQIRDRRWRVFAGAAGAASWFPLVFFRQALQNGSANSGVSAKPRLLDLVRFYRKLPYGPDSTGHSVSVLVLLLLLLFVVAGIVFAVRGSALRAWRSTPFAVDAPWLVFAFAGAPALLFLLSLVAKPVLVDRYLFPYTLSFSALFAFALAITQRLLPRLGANGLAVLLLGAAVPLHWLTLQEWTRMERPNVQSLHAPDGVVAVTDLAAFFELQFYKGSSDLRIFYVGPVGDADVPNMARSIHRSGYWAGQMLTPAQFEGEFSRFLVIGEEGSPEMRLWEACGINQGAVLVERTAYAVVSVSLPACKDELHSVG